MKRRSRKYILNQLDQYRKGGISIGRLAENLGGSIKDAMALVIKHKAQPPIPKDVFDEAIATAERLSGPGLRVFARLAKRWDLSEEEQLAILGVPSRRALAGYLSQKGIGLVDVLMRISYLLGIYKALQILLPDEESADTWVKSPNGHKLFKGTPALSIMIKEGLKALRQTREYLDRCCNGY